MDERLLILAAFLWFFKPFLGAIVVGTIFATLLYPIYNKRPGKLTAAILTLLCIVISVLLIYQTSFYLYDQVNTISEFFNTVSPELQLQIIDVSSHVDAVGFFSEFLTSIPGMAINFILIFVATFFFLTDGHRISGAIRKLFPPKKANALLKEGTQNLQSILMGIFVSMFTYIFFCTIVLFLTKTPFALLYAVLAGLFGPVPIVSGWMIIAWVIFSKIMAGQYIGAAIVLGFQLLWYFIADLYFRMKYRGNIHPGILIFSIFAGMKVFGFAGLVIGPVLTSLAYTWILVESEF